jgi:hypothetical protein
MRTLLLPSPSGSAAPPTGHNSVATIQHVEASSETTNAFLGTYFRAGLYVSQFQYLAKRLSRHRANLNAEWRPRPNVMMPGLAGRRRSSSIALTYDSLLQEQR